MNFINRGARVIIQNNSQVKSLPNPTLLNYLKDKKVSYLSRYHGEEESIYTIKSTENHGVKNRSPLMLIYNESTHYQQQRLADLERLTCYFPVRERIILNLEPDYQNLMEDPFQPTDDYLNIIPIAERLDYDLTQFNLISAGLEKSEIKPFIKKIYKSPINFTYLHLDTLLLEYSGNAFREELLPGDLHKIVNTILKSNTLGIVEFTNTSNNPDLIKSLSKKIIKYITQLESKEETQQSN